MKIKFAGMALILLTAGLLAGCGGGGGSSTPAASALSGTAAVGYPIAGGTINVSCAAGSALNTTTSNTGGWQVTVSGQTLPCAVQVAGGTINGGANTTLYHSIASAWGTVNVTPLTDLMVASLAGTATPNTWFAGLNSTALNAITQSQIDAALTQLRTALALTPLNTINPITTAFTPTPGNTGDDMLAALSAAMTSASITYANLLSNASATTFSTPAGFGTALTTAYAGTTSGGTSGGGGSGSGTGTTSGSTTAPLASLANGSYYRLVYSAGMNVGIDQRKATAHFSSSGAMSDYTAIMYDGSLSTSEAPSLGAASVAELAGDDKVTIGRWNGGTTAGSFYSISPIAITANQGFHYAIGVPPASLPADGTSKCYALTAATHPTIGDGSVAPGSVTPGAQVKIIFGATGKLAIDMTFTVGSNTIAVQTPGGMDSPITFGSNGAYYSASSPAPFGYTIIDSANNTTSAYIFLAGANSERLGMSYTRYQSAGGNSASLQGTAYFSETTCGSGGGGGGSSGLMGGAIQGTPLNLTTTVTTLAGYVSAIPVPVTDGTGTAASFYSPYGVTTDGTNLYVVDIVGNIRKMVIASGAVTTLVGPTLGANGSTDDTGTAARFTLPRGITTDGTNLYVADTGNSTIRQIVIATGAVTTLAGTAGSTGITDGTGAAARFYLPSSITTDGTNLYVADSGNHTIRQVVIATGAVTTLAGTASPFFGYGSTDGTGTAAKFSGPAGITTDGTNLYVADTGNNAIRNIVIATGVVTTLAGGTWGSTDGTGTAAQFYSPSGIVTDGTNLYVADSLNTTIRKIVIATGAVTTLASTGWGTAGWGSAAVDGTGAAARFARPQGITSDGTNLYVSDIVSTTIRKIQ